MATIDNLTLDINLDDSASAKLEKLAGALSALKDLSVSGAKFNGIAKGIKNLNTAINNITDESIERLEKLANALASIGAIDASSISKVARAASKFSTANAGTASKSAYSALKNQIVPVTMTQKPFEGEDIPSADDVKEFYGSYREVGEEVLKTNEKLKQGFGETESEFKARSESIARSMRNIAGTPFRLMGRAFEGLGSAIKRIMAPLNGFIRSIGRIALYRALRSAIKAISGGIKEGVQNLAQFSKLMNEMDTHKANRVMSLYASNFLYLKNTIATAVIPILKILEPIVASIINKVIDLTNVIAQLFSAISGSSTYTKAKYYYLDYADSLDKASGSAGKLNKQLAKFDELNNLTTSSGSGKDNALDYLKMFEDPVPIADWIEKLKDNIQNGNWEALGQKIADKVKHGLGSINWTSEFEKSFNAGAGFASFLNGLVDPEAFHEVGKTIAGAIMMGINFALGFAENFEFDQLGLSIAEGINGFFENFDGAKTADAITKIAHGLEEAFRTAVKNVKWKEVFKDLGTLIGKVTIDNLDLILKAVLIVTVAKFAVSFTQGALTELSRQIGAIIASKVGIRLTGLGITEVGSGVGAGIISKIFGAGAAGAAGGKAGGAILTGGSQYAGALSGGASTAGTATFGTVLGNIFSGVIVAAAGVWAVDAIRQLRQGKSWEDYKFLGSFREKAEGVEAKRTWGKSKGVNDSELESAKRSVEIARNKYQQIYDTHAATMQKIVDETKKTDETVIEGWIDTSKTITNSTRDKYQQIYDTHASAMQKSIDNASKATKSVRTKYQQIYDTHAATMQKMIDETNGVSSNYEKMGQSISASSSSAFESVSNSSSSATTKVTANINSIKTESSNAFSKTVWNGFGTNINNGLTAGFGSAVDAMKATWNNFKTYIANNPIKAVVSGAVSGVDTGVKAVETIIETNPKQTFTPTPTSSKIRVKNPNYANSSAQRAWELAHPRDKYEWYAHGGFPSMGSMFFAGESGAELVGNINGRTGVANTDQIEAAIYQASYDAMSKALSENNMSVIVEGDADGMFRAFQRKANDFYTRTGRAAI